MYRIAVCDDNLTLCHYIEKILLDYGKASGLKLDVEVFYEGQSLCSFIEKEHVFDLIYLDIEMDTLDGIKTGKLIRENMEDLNTEIAYISGTKQYDRQLFSVQPLQFIPKPFKSEAIISTLKLAIKRKQVLNASFYFKIGQEIVRIPYEQILYFESNNRTIIVVTKDNKISYYDKLSNVIKKLPICFSQIHRSYIVNRNNIYKYSSTHVTMNNQDVLPISQSYSKEFTKVQLKDIEGEINP